ncbi:zinc finger protein OZF-like [Stylophora pistillata]|uniref:zinc finger protein OZF-like n=1 Tax=Stylophora pistillata TaxID=50429 RepID=UPI000C03CF48|nr:zinc finger protein OZF-like [Stylophora pistillata]
MQLILTLHDLAKAIQSSSIHAVVLDFAKAFDKVPHTRLLRKLHHYGIQGPLLIWLESFLTHRFQSVACEVQTSNQLPVTSGVPQGTVLGPLLFLLYINDLPDNVQSTIRLFADDALLYGVIASDADCDLLQSDLHRLESWQHYWQMEFSPSKCKIVTISHKINPAQRKYVFCGVELEQLDSFPYLGVTISNKLKCKCFSQAGNLRKHHTVFTGEKPFQCKVCNKCFTQAGNLRKHHTVHSGEKPFQCKVCSKCFSQAGNLRKHHTVHTGEKPFQCKVCNKCFTQAGSLRKHHSVHTGEKPFQCKVCGKCFSEAGSLGTHHRVHTGEKPFQCKVCGKCFSEAGSLGKHDRVHTGEKPFQCKVCDKRFSDAGNLRRHNKVHLDREFSCWICQVLFRTKGALHKHYDDHMKQALRTTS